MMKSKNSAIALLLLSSFSFSLMQSVVKLSSAQIGTFQQVFFRNLICLFVSLFFLLKRRNSLFPPRQYLIPVAARSFFGFLGVAALFIAASNARQADVSLLNRTSPVWVTLFSCLILREKISRIQVPVIVLCLLGAVLAMRPSFDSAVTPLLFALLSAVSSGIAYTMIAFCKGAVDPFCVIFNFSLFSVILAGLLMIPSYVSPSPYDLMMLLIIGLLGASGQICLTFAYQKAPASEVSIYNYSGILFAAVFGRLFFGEELRWSTAAGAVLIVGASVLAYFCTRTDSGSNTGSQKK